MSAAVHEVIVLPAGDMGGWYARCGGCPDWMGRPELSKPEARRRHTEHVHEVSMAAVAASPFVAGHRGESRMVVDYSADALVPPRPVTAVERRARRFWPLVGGVVAAALAVVAAGVEGGAFL